MSSVALIRGFCLCVTVLAVWCTAAFAQSGELDRSFGANGHVLFPGRANQPRLDTAAVDSRGRIIVAGSQFGFGAGDNPHATRVVVYRLLESGRSDSSFGKVGRIELRFASDWHLASTFADAEDRLVLSLGGLSKGGHSIRRICRLTTDGRLDDTFGSSGCVRTDAASSSDDGIALDQEGRPMYVGDGEIRRLTVNGQPDPSFGTDGAAKLLEGDPEYDVMFHAPVVDDTGTITVTGLDYDTDTWLSFAERFDPDGLVDDGFADGGVLGPLQNLRVDMRPIAVDDAGRLLFGFPGLSRLTPEGEMDDSFNAASSRGPFPTNIAVDADGRPVTTFANSNNDYGTPGVGIARFRRSGRLDRRYGENGRTYLRLRNRRTFDYALALTPDGGAVVLGSTRDRVAVLFRLR